MPDPDPYTVLGVATSSARDTILEAYRRLARVHHPDRPGGSHDHMVQLNRAWAVLGDAASRRAYDRSVGIPDRQPAAPAAARPPAAAGETVLDFGRYAGASLRQIAAEDPDYLEWLARSMIGRAFRAEIETLLHPAPARAGRPPHAARTRARR